MGLSPFLTVFMCGVAAVASRGINERLRTERESLREIRNEHRLRDMGEEVVYRRHHQRDWSGSEGPGDSFQLYFTNRTQVLALFEEGDGKLTTDGSLTCVRPDHLFYDTDLPDCKCKGLKIRMDNVNADCDKNAHISTGHLASRLTYSYGDFEIRARVAHSLSGGDPPHNAFTCFSAYIGASESTEHYHNEIALCWPGTDTKQLHMGYWYGKDGDRMHRTEKSLGFDAAKEYHSYKFKWRNDSITFMVDGKVIHKDYGSTYTLPFEDLSIRVILRPDDRPSVYEGVAAYDVEYISYTAA